MTDDGDRPARPPARRLAPRVTAVATPERLAAAFFLALGVAAFLPTLGGGFLLQLDMVFAPRGSHLQFALDTKGPLYYGRLPFVALLDALALVVPEWLVQRAVLVGTVAGAGYAAYTATDGQRPIARLFAGTLYAVNPFVYVRLLAGQWYVALGYAVLPLAVVSFYRYVTGERSRPTRAVGWATLVAVFDPHVAVLLAVAGGLVLVPVVREQGRVALTRAGRFGGFAVSVNAYWLLPALVALVGETSQLATVTGADLVVFSPRGAVAGNVPLSVSMLYGFWRGGYVYPFDLVPLWVVVGLFALLLGVAVYGWLGSDDTLADGLVLTAVVGGVLGLGVTTDLSAPLFRAVAATPIGAGMREAGKFVALVALAYALLGARGVTQLAGELDAALAARQPSVGGWRPDREQFRRGVALAFAVAVIALPLAYTFPMVAGFWGAFEPTQYPDDWHAADDRFAADGGDYRVLYLPWHQYLEYEWTGGIVASPAPLFFDAPVVNSRDPEVGVGSQATDPTHERLRSLLEDREGNRFGSRVAPLGVKYVVLSKAADYPQYAFLREQTDLAVVSEGDHLVVFENRAFEPARADAWPAMGPPVPTGALLGGGLLSLATVGALAAGRRQRPHP
ncbi:hypothetical protein [Halorarius litoreus]|uniref:hypothetical protein n=1 Tax=Halorarius litoreus TaxID=2962676 RepID=UPI0020CF6F32|nr:hypothetical protein [Halorarius litoreus]